MDYNKLLAYTTQSEWKKKYPKFDDEVYRALEDESKRRIVVAGSGVDITKKQAKKYQTNIQFGDFLVEFDTKL